MARLPNFLVIIRSEKLSGKGQGRGAKKRTFRFGKKNVSFPKVETFRFADYIFPLTFRFLATYQVSMEVENTITLSSYMDTLMMMSLMMGIVFEIPVLCWLFAKLGFLTADFMKRYRRHAIVIILIVGAVITPTSDVFTLMMVSVPMYLLYEVSIWIVSRIGKKQREESVEEVLEKS